MGNQVDFLALNLSIRFGKVLTSFDFPIDGF